MNVLCFTSNFQHDLCNTEKGDVAKKESLSLESQEVK